MDKCIITGADGFIGSATTNYLLTKGIEVLAIGRKETPKRLIKRDGLSYLKCDINNNQQLIDLLPKNYYDTLIHFAWEGIGYSDRSDIDLQTRNCQNTINMLKVASQLECKRFIGAGSIIEKEAMFATDNNGSFSSLASSIYGISKYSSHCICKALAAKFKIDFIWPIITNTYGEGENSTRFISSTLKKIKNNEDLNFSIANQNYDFIHISDVAKAFYLIAQKGKPFNNYTIGSGDPKPLKEFILEILKAFDVNKKPNWGAIPFSGINLPLEDFYTSNLAEDCGFQIEIPFITGIKNTMEWLKKQPY